MTILILFRFILGLNHLSWGLGLSGTQVDYTERADRGHPDLSIEFLCPDHLKMGECQTAHYCFICLDGQDNE